MRTVRLSRYHFSSSQSLAVKMYRLLSTYVSAVALSACFVQAMEDVVDYETFAMRRLQGGRTAWPADKADRFNSGRSSGAGPGSNPGYCRDKWLPADLTNTLQFASSGVSTTAQSSIVGHFIGDSTGVLRMFLDLGGSILEDILVSPAQVFGVPSNTGLQGLWASPAAVFDPVSQQDIVIVPSLDGHVYALSQMGCADMTAGLKGRVLQSGPGACGVWQFTTPHNQPFAGAPVVSVANGIVYVTETNMDLATGGYLWALNLTTGNTVWMGPFEAQYQGDIYPLLGVSASLNPVGTTPDAQLIVAFGPVVFVLDALTGGLLTSEDNIVGGTGACPKMFTVGENFVSSPSVTVEGTQAQIFLQTARGNLWSYMLQIDGTSGAPFLQCEFACTYYYNTGNPPYCEMPNPPDEVEASVPGGWYQATNAAQRDELHQAIRDAHSERFGAEASAAVLAKFSSSSSGKAGAVNIKPVVEMARQLRMAGHDMTAITTPSDYVRLAANGSPATSAMSLFDYFGGVYTFSTPAVSPDNNYVAMTTYGDGKTNSQLGVLVLQTSNGAGASTTFSVGNDVNGNPLPYARSRSTPAWDVNGNLYFTADFDFSQASIGSGLGGWNDTLPALVVLYGADGSLRPVFQWAVDLGTEFSGSVGLASPVIADGADPNTRRVIAAGPMGSLHVAKGCGAKCGSSTPLQECSGHGTCNGFSGNCTCQAAWNSPNDNTCGAKVGCDHGLAQPDGSCLCQPCFENHPTTGRCTLPLDCMNGGYCERNGTKSVCLCPFCNSADPTTGLCTVPTTTCGPNSTGCDMDQCVCDPCFTVSDDGTSCVPMDCGSGTCDASSGNAICVCTDCTTNDPTTGMCTQPLQCGNGQCDSSSGTSKCVCNKCWQTDASGSCSQPLDCGPGGICSTDEGVCENNGDNCWLYDRTTGRYDTYQTCSTRGTCNDATGHCTCNTGWSNLSIPNPCAACDACHSGAGKCNIQFSCSGNGVCTLGETAAHRVCVCSPGWSGDACDVPYTPDNSPKGVNPALAAGVGIPVALLGLAAAGFYFVRMRGRAYSRLAAPGSGVVKEWGSSSSSGGGYQSSSKGLAGAAAPKTFASIGKSAGFDSAAAKAAVARLGSVTGTKDGTKDGPAPSATSSLLASRGKAGSIKTPIITKPKGSYGGL